MAAEKIREGFPVFLHDGEVAVGAVRRVTPLTVYIENSGDFVVPAAAVHDVHFDKVILDSGKIGHDMRGAIARAHRSEDPDNSKSHKGEA
ncbi:MAG: hypothetical protein GC155_18680 [Alphaproteobacteria bacterium]|nr:hypothetical protein [Alphaproteobacteria bacterium]